MLKVLLIAGHGASDPGAIGVNGLRECDLTRELVKKVYDELATFSNVAVTVYPTDRNAYDDVKSGKLAVSGHYDYVFEIHFNAHGNPAAHGSECYVTTNEKGITVEKHIMEHMKDYFALRDNDNVFDGVKTTDFAVINHFKSKGSSSALLETCFITSPEDMNTYAKNKANIAHGIVCGIIEKFGIAHIHGVVYTYDHQVGETVKYSTHYTNAKDCGACKNYVTDNPFKQSKIVSRETLNDHSIYKLENGHYVNDGDIREVVTVKATVSQPTPQKKAIQELATEVIQGKWGNDPIRTQRLTEAGYDAKAVRDEVNRRYGVNTTTSSKKSVQTIANEIWTGKCSDSRWSTWGNDPVRTQRLKAAGYTDAEIQAIRNELNKK